MSGNKWFLHLVDRWVYIPSEEKVIKPSLTCAALLLISSVGIILSLYLPWSVSIMPLGLGLPLYGGPFKILSGFATFTSPVLFPETDAAGILIILGYLSCSTLLFIIELASLMRHPPNLALGILSFFILFTLIMVTSMVMLNLTGIYILEIITERQFIYVYTFASILWPGPVSMFACSIPLIPSSGTLIKRAFFM